MNELRWILLIAGALLIAGIYFWGLRSRGRRSVVDEAARRPAVFTGGATGFETADPARPEAADPIDEPAIARETRRLEPSVSLEHDDFDTDRPAIERRAGLDLATDGQAPAGGRREPTFGQRAEPPTPAPGGEPTFDGTRQEPTFGSRADPPATQAEPVPRPESAPPATAPPSAAGAAEALKPKRPQKIFAVRVTAPGSSRFTGQRVLEALQTEGLRFGRYDIFHSLHADGRPVFSVASLRDPGTFDPQTMAETLYPGILVFAVLPGPVSASDAFDDMLFTARALATHLEGALADEKGVPLTAHRAGRLREEALEFERAVHAA